MKHRGFTLIEYILYIAISSVVLVALLRGTLMLFDTRNKLAAIQPQQEELRFTMRRMTRAIRNALLINASASVFDSSNGTLSLVMGDASINPTVFSFQNGVIFVQEGSASPLAMTSSKIIVEELTFTNLSAPTAVGTVKISVRARPVSSVPALPFFLDTAASLRQ